MSVAVEKSAQASVYVAPSSYEFALRGLNGAKPYIELPHVSPESPPYRRIVERVVGNKRLKLEVLDEQVFNVHSWKKTKLRDAGVMFTQIQFITGFHPYLGIPIRGWTGVETVLMRQVLGRTETGQRTEIPEMSGTRIMKFLKKNGIEIDPIKSNDQPAKDFNSCKNFDRPHLYYALPANRYS
jgi:hypothetical protein